MHSAWRFRFFCADIRYTNHTYWSEIHVCLNDKIAILYANSLLMILLYNYTENNSYEAGFLLMLCRFMKYMFMALYTLLSICELPWLLRRYSEMMSRCLHRVFEFGVSFHLHRLPPKAKESRPFLRTLFSI